MTDMADDEVKALLDKIKFRSDGDAKDVGDLARALLEARAEVTRLRADAQAAVAVAWENGVAQARLAVSGHMDWNPSTVRDDILINIDNGCSPPVDGLAMVEALRGALVEARDAAHSMAHDEYDGVWSEQDFSDYTPLADAALAARPAKEGGKPAPRTDYENSCPDCGPICSC
jgi:hypothetical protein